MANAFRETWDLALATQSPPIHFKGITRFPYAEFRTRAFGDDLDLAHDFVDAVYGGKVVVLDDAFTRAEVMEIKDICVKFSQTHPESATQRITADCPDYHQIFDSSMKPQAGYEAVDRSYYFFPWNGDATGLIAKVQNHWQLSKIFNGFAPDAFTNNRPEDGIVDRLHIKHYPSGCGRISTHVDPVVRLQMISAVHITEYGTDYHQGSYYALDAEGQRHYLDPELRSGCMVMFYPQIPHGVTTVDPDVPVNWDSPQGRWFMLLFNPQSHIVENRKKATSVAG